MANNIDGATSAEIAAMKLSEPLDPGTVTTHSAQVAFEKVLATAGCSLKRDIIDERIVRETRGGTATFMGSYSQVGGIIDSQNDLKPSGAGSDWSAWPTLESVEAPKDTDQDGMPDEWEEANGLNARDPRDRNKTDLSDIGYTNLEVYLHSLVAHIVAQELSDYEYVTGNGVNDLPSAIHTPTQGSDSQDVVWHDLTGRIVLNPTQPGIYLSRHQKMIIR